MNRPANDRPRANPTRLAGSSSEALGNAEPVPGTQAIRRALAVLHAFADGDAEMSISELAEACHLSPSTTHRICRALMMEGFLQQNEANTRYSLGHAAVLLGQLAQRNYGLDRVLMLLEEVGEKTGESVNLGIRVGDVVMVLMRVESFHPLRFEQAPGTKVPLHASAMGKAFLAFSPDAPVIIESLGPLERFTPTTICDPEALLGELERIREQGYSIDDEEGIVGVRCVGVPVLDRRGASVAAVAVQVPAPRLPKSRRAEITPLMLDLARKVADVVPVGRAPFAVEY